MGAPSFRFISSYVHHGRVGVLVEFGMQSDFTVKTEEFRLLSEHIAMHIVGLNPDGLESLLKQPFSFDENRTVGGVLADASALLKESIVVTRFIRWDTDVAIPDRPVPPKGPAAVVRLGGRP
jgi:elongation factor Ts